MANTTRLKKEVLTHLALHCRKLFTVSLASYIQGDEKVDALDIWEWILFPKDGSTIITCMTGRD